MAADSFPWSDALLLGYAPMDATHREFVALVDALLTCPDAEVPERLQAFADHVEIHFGQELQWMEASGFPPMPCHASEHTAVMMTVAEVQKRVAAGDVQLARRLAQELARWFPGHADYMDAPLAQWLEKKRQGEEPVATRRCGVHEPATG